MELYEQHHKPNRYNCYVQEFSDDCSTITFVLPTRMWCIATDDQANEEDEHKLQTIERLHDSYITPISGLEKHESGPPG